MTALGLLTALLVNFAPPTMPESAQAPSQAMPELRDPFVERHPRPPHFQHPDLIDPFGPQKLRTPKRGDRPSTTVPSDPFDASAPNPPSSEVAGLVDPFQA